MSAKDNLSNLDYRVGHAFPQSLCRDNIFLSCSPQESGMRDFKSVTGFNRNMLHDRRVRKRNCGHYSFSGDSSGLNKSQLEREDYV